MILVSIPIVFGPFRDSSIQSNTINNLAHVESSFFLGGNMTDEAKGGAIDEQNNTIISGYTASSNFFVTENNNQDFVHLFGYTSSENLPIKGIDSTFEGVTDAFYVKFYIPPVENPIITISSASTLTSSNEISSSADIQTSPVSNTSSSSDTNISVKSRIVFLSIVGIITNRRYFSNRFSTLK